MHYTVLSQTGENAAYNTTSFLCCQTIYATVNLSIHYILCVNLSLPEAMGALKCVFAVHYVASLGAYLVLKKVWLLSWRAYFRVTRKLCPSQKNARLSRSPAARVPASFCHHSAEVRRVRRGVGVNVAFSGASAVEASGADVAEASDAATAVSPPARYLARHSEQ